MFSRAYRTAAIMLVAASMLWGFPATHAQALLPASQSLEGANTRPSTTVVVYSQPPISGGGLFQSSLRDPDGSASDQWAWDDFTLGWTQTITEVQWRGGYDPARLGSGGPVVDFTLAIYPSNAGGFEPDVSHPPLVHYQLGGNAGETPADVLGGVQTYDYGYALPVPFQAVAGMKYWVQIEALQRGAPDWGFSKATGGDGHYFRKLADEGIYQHATGDTAFTLLGPLTVTPTGTSTPTPTASATPTVTPTATSTATATPTGTRVSSSRVVYLPIILK
jgi:hypothetical protein